MPAFSGALVPEPLLAVTISESPRRGAKTRPLLIVGHGVLELAFVAAAFLGLRSLLRQRMVTMVVSIVGSAVLLGMAWGMVRALPRLSLSTVRQGSASRWLPVTGMVLSLAIPYWLAWWVGFELVYAT